MSTAAPPFVITFTIISSDFVFFTPLVAATSFFLSSLEDAFLFGGSFGGLGAFLGETAFFPFGYTLAGVTCLAGVTFLEGATTGLG